MTTEPVSRSRWTEREPDAGIVPPARAALGAMRRAAIPTPISPAVEVDDRGYVRLELMCPISDKRGRVARHRFVLWDSLGRPSPSSLLPCRWCSYQLPWKSALEPAFRFVINVDHLNGVPGDDRVENLAPSCWWCNVNRSWAMAVAPLWWERFSRWFGQVHPSQRPNLRDMVAEVIGINPRWLTDGPTGGS